ncbi:Glycerol-3-phosphate responsive antiterminator (mRNA-binding) [Lachnospiraceae bacterium KH1T2]|nr:Glycerol-3-phosphate responsive antiterminator (mRNA-binding) [Lachnospiraceae bacterium KH1T2]
MRRFIELIEDTPIIAAVKDDEGLELSLTTDSSVIFVLYGDVCSLPDIVKKIHDAGKTAMVHIDLINGLSSRDTSVDFIKKYTEADGIITTKNALIPHAKEIGLHTILRYFVLDSMALVNIEKQARHGVAQPDFIEILPGVILPSVIQKINSISRVPVIAGGLITTKEEVMNALNNGAIAISSTNQKVWFM